MQSGAAQGNQAALAELEAAPKLPPPAANVWEYFSELHQARGGNGFGPVPICYTEIDAWQRLTKQRLDPWELKAILRLDEIFLVSHAKANKGNK